MYQTSLGKEFQSTFFSSPLVQFLTRKLQPFNFVVIQVHWTAWHIILKVNISSPGSFPLLCDDAHQLTYVLFHLPLISLFPCSFPLAQIFTPHFISPSTRSFSSHVIVSNRSYWGHFWTPKKNSRVSFPDIRIIISLSLILTYVVIYFLYQLLTYFLTIFLLSLTSLIASSFTFIFFVFPF